VYNIENNVVIYVLQEVCVYYRDFDINIISQLHSFLNRPVQILISLLLY